MARVFAITLVFEQRAPTEDSKQHILPQAVHAKGHEVVHLVVRLGDAGKDAGDAAGLFLLVDCLEAKMCRAPLLGSVVVAARGRGGDRAHGDAGAGGATHRGGAGPQTCS